MNRSSVLDGVDGRLEAVEPEIRAVKADLTALRKDLPAIVAGSLRDVLREGAKP